MDRDNKVGWPYRGWADNIIEKEKKEEEHLYGTFLADTTLTKHSDMDHTVLPANYNMSAFPS